MRKSEDTSGKGNSQNPYVEKKEQNYPNNFIWMRKNDNNDESRRGEY